jgi:hypothetical protein
VAGSWEHGVWINPKRRYPPTLIVQNITLYEHFNYPFQDAKFRKCSWVLFRNVGYIPKCRLLMFVVEVIVFRTVFMVAKLFKNVSGEMSYIL